jgi:hypothetical protein
MGGTGTSDKDINNEETPIDLTFLLHVNVSDKEEKQEKNGVIFTP